MAEGAGFEPARPYGRWISSPLPYQLGLTLRTTAFDWEGSLLDSIVISNLVDQMQEKSERKRRRIE